MTELKTPTEKEADNLKEEVSKIDNRINKGIVSAYVLGGFAILGFIMYLILGR